MLLLVPGGLAAEGEIAVSIVDIDDTAFPRVQAVITADIDGRPLEALEAGQLRVLEGAVGAAVEATVLDVTPAVDAGTPLALVLVVDASGSMVGAPIAEARAAAASLVESLAPGDAAAIVAFANEVIVLQEMTEDRADLLAAIERLDGLGNTALYDAVADAADLAGSSQFSRRAVVLLSDGEDFGGLSEHTREQALEAVSAGSALFYVVGFGTEIERTFLEEVADRSGGRFFLASGLDEIAAVYTSLEQLLRGQLVVTFESAAPAAAREREIRIEITLEAGTGAVDRPYASVRPAAPISTPAPAVTPAPIVETPAAEPEAADGGSPWLPLLLAFGVAALGGLTVVVVRRRRGASASRPTLHLSALDRRPLPVDEDVRTTAEPGYLEVINGALDVASVGLRDGPVTVGSGSTCTLRLPPTAGVAAEHARVWQRDGRPMLHHLAAGVETRVNGVPSEWASLKDGDQIEIGEHVIRYRTTEPDARNIPEVVGGTR